MKDAFLQQLNKILRDYRRRKYLLAISGGVDSMVLLHVFKESNLDFEVLHCNFQLREQDSENDQILVEQFCSQNQILITLKRFDTNSILEKSSGESLQMVARRIRYEWFEKQLLEKKADFIVTAHHLSDQIETVLFNLVRGTGISGLRGMLPIHEKVLRPLLTFTKEEIYDFAKQENIVWREDYSNKSDKYKRNFIRNQVIPLFKTLNPNFEHTFLTNIEKFAGYEQLIKQFCPEFEFIDEKKSIFISNELILNQRNVIFWFESLKKFDFSFEQIKNFVEITVNKVQSGKKILSITGFLLLKVNDGWELSKAEESSKIDLTFESFEDERVADFFKLENITVSEVDFGLGSNVVYLDAQKLIFPLRLRNWKEGDRFKPFGLKGTKKVSDYLINLKLSITEKEKVLVLEDADGEIVWLVGFRLAQKCSLTPQTTHVLKMRVI